MQGVRRCAGMQATHRPVFYTSPVDDAVRSVGTFTNLSLVEESEVIRAFNHHKYVIVHLIDSHSDPKEELRSLRRIFGSHIPHDRGDEHGIAPITPMPGFTQYLGTSYKQHNMHTDGTFNSVAPATAILLCLRPAETGGMSQLVSGQAAYRHLLEYDPEGLEALFDEDAMTVTRAGKSATRPVFSRVDSLLRIAFRYDTIAGTEVKQSAKRAFELLRKFVTNPVNIREFRLEPNQMLILDNTSVLHGRTEFAPKEPRMLYRLNTDGVSGLSNRLVYGFRP